MAASDGSAAATAGSSAETAATTAAPAGSAAGGTPAATSTQELMRLVLAGSEEKAVGMNVDTADSRYLYVDDLPLLASAEFQSVVSPFIGKPITLELLNNLGSAIGKYAREHDRLITKVLVPNQTVTDGTVRLVVVFGRFNQLAFAGNKWFSSKLLEERLGIKPGDEVRLSVLEEAVNWANTNPFRRLRVLVNEVTNQPGKADLLVGVQEVMPWRFAFAYDNYGNELLGTNHYTGSVQFGNLWGLDHQGSYQFVTTDDTQLYQLHSFNYRVPLRWRHFIDITGAYIRVKPEIVPGLISQPGETMLGNLRYTLPVRRGDNPIEFYAGLDFKRSNNDYEYAGMSVRPRSTDTFQASVGGSVVRRDKRGNWLFSGTLYLSPGNVDQRNDQETYQSTRFGSNPRYLYAQVSIQRSLILPHDWQATSRLVGQIASTNLVPNEQMVIGGATSVRGFETNVFAGDEGFVMNNELQSPAIKTSLARLRKSLPALETRFAAFYDAAQVFVKKPIGTDPKKRPMASAGLGVRMNVSNNFSLNFDYGWQLTDLPYPVGRQSRGHIKAVLAF